MGVPYSQIEYFPARDAQAYAGNPRAAVDDAIHEGFKLRPKMIDEWSRPGTVLKHFCIPWTFTMIFKKIMETRSKQYFMFLLDDYRLACDFFYLNEFVETVHKDAKNRQALIIQLEVLHIIDFLPITDRPPVKRFKGLVRGLGARVMQG